MNIGAVHKQIRAGIEVVARIDIHTEDAGDAVVAGGEGGTITDVLDLVLEPLEKGSEYQTESLHAPGERELDGVNTLV